VRTSKGAQTCASMRVARHAPMRCARHLLNKTLAHLVCQGRPLTQGAATLLMHSTSELRGSA